MDNELSKKVSSLIDKINKLFGSNYNISYIPKKSYERNVIINNNYAPSYPFYPYYPNYVSHTVVEHTKDKDEEEEKDKVKNQIFGTVIVTGVSFAATFMLANDDYVKLWRSGVSSDLNDILNTSYEMQQFSNVEDAIIKCEEWIKEYENRTKKTFVSKVGLITSGLAIGVSIFLSQKEMALMATASLVASGCYMLWHSLDNTKNYGMEKELETFNNALSSLNNVIVIPNLNDNFLFYASAPPLDEINKS